MGRCECEGGRSRLSKYAGLALLFCLLWLTAGCGNSFLDEQLSSQGQGSVSTPAPTFRALGTAVERRIGQGGGVLEAQAEDGTVYTLTVPEGALAEEQLLRMLPVAVSGRLGLPVELGFAVTIEPSGTQFTGGALLEITLPQGVDARAFRAYVMDDSGSPMSLYASSVSGQTVSFRLYHLTTPGLSDSPVPNPPVSDGASAMDTMAAQVASRLSQIQALQQLGADASQTDPLFREIDNILSDFFQNSLRPLLQSTAQSGSDAACQSALRDALRFEQVVQQVGSQVVSSNEIRTLMIPVFQRGITAAGEEAVTADSLEKLNSINTFYLAQARLLGIATAVNQLDAETVKSQVPFKVVITKVEASPTLIPGDGTTQLRVSGGYQLGSNPVKTSPNFVAEVSLVGGTSPDLPLQPSLQNTGQAIFNLVRLSELSERITGTAVGHFAHFAVVGAQPFTSEPFNFAIEGQLSITLEATSQGSDATLTARVRKGNAPVSNAVVSFVKLSGAGAVNPSAMTNAEGVVTGTVTGIDDSTQVRASVSRAGQNASAEVSVSRDGEPLPENYGLVAFGYLVGLEPNHPMYNVQMRLLLRFEGEQIVEGDFGGGMIGAINFINADFVRVSISNHVLTFETEPDLLPTFWSGSIDLPSSRPGTLPYRGTFTFSFPDNAGSGTYDVELDELIFTDEEGLPL